MRSCTLRCLTECLALRMCWTDALKPRPSQPSLVGGQGSPWLFPSCIWEKPGKVLVQGRKGLLSRGVDAAVGAAPACPIPPSPDAAPALPPDASLRPTQPFRCLARDLINSPLVSFSDNETGSACEITHVRQLL